VHYSSLHGSRVYAGDPTASSAPRRERLGRASSDEAGRDDEVKVVIFISVGQSVNFEAFSVVAMQQPVPDNQALLRRAAVANREQAQEKQKKGEVQGEEDASLWEVYVSPSLSLSVATSLERTGLDSIVLGLLHFPASLALIRVLDHPPSLSLLN